MRKIAAFLLFAVLAGCKNEGVVPAPRVIARNVTMRIVVADTSTAVEALAMSAESLGGYVSSSHVWRDGDSLRATVSLRVPSKKLTAALASVRSVARRVEDERLTSDDVTQRCIDLTAITDDRWSAGATRAGGPDGPR